MNRWETYVWNVATITVTLSGVAYFWMKHVMENQDPFSVVNHPWQPAMLALHVVAAPALVFGTGLIVKTHVLKKLASGDPTHRRSGLATTIVLPVMILSGYVLQVVSSPLLARTVLFVHLGSSTVFVLTYLAHQLMSMRRPEVAARRSVRAVSPRRIT